MRAWLTRVGDWVVQDVRYALRGLRRSPAFTATVVITLGLGIGANAAMFGVMDRLMFRPFPYLRDPARVNRVYLVRSDRDRINTTYWTEYTRYLDLKKYSTSFSQVATIAPLTLAVGSGDAVRERPVAAVSASFFEFFDMRPALGRFFVAAEDATPRGASVAVLSYAFWKNELGGRDVLGQTLLVRNIQSVIIGVAPEGFVGIADGEPPAVFIPVTTYGGNDAEGLQGTYYTTYRNGWVHVMVRRKSGVSETSASQDLSNAHVRSWNDERAMQPSVTPAEVARPRAIAGPLRTPAGPDAGLESKTLFWVTGVAVIVLLITCANVANLMFARMLRRRREIALRLALGVSRGRLIAQSLTESLLLTALGCVVGVVIAQWGGVVLRRLFVGDGSSLDILTDGRTLAAAASVAVVAGLLAGLAPAILATKPDLAGSLKAGAREGTHQRSRMRGALLVMQGALSVILLIGAGLFVQSLSHVRDLRMGFNAEQVLVASRNLRGMTLGDSGRAQMGRRLLDAAQRIPGVSHATWVNAVPLASSSNMPLFVPGIDSVRKLGRFTFQAVTADYFATLDTRIVRGRGFTGDDRANSTRVAVVSEAMAQVLWPGRDALGQCIRVRADTMPCATVVGVAENAIQETEDLQGRRKPYRYYLPLDQYNSGGGNTLLIRMRGDPATNLESVRRVLQAAMPGESYLRMRLLRDVVDGQRRSWKMGATMFVAFGALALLVAAVGLYGMISYNVAQRMHELGVRVALGAQTTDVLRLIVAQGIRFAGAGVITGILLALVGARWIQPLLFKQSATDPVTYGVAGAVLLLVALIASAVPAVRATRADPNTALRAD